nr:probable polyamine transporter At1g31830 isoform X1 [Tanacetum cinerariifolium]
MGTMFSEDGGYVIWVSSALGPYWGFQQGWMKWLSGVIDNALYHVLFLDYLKSGFPILADGYPRIVAIVALTGALTYMNFRGHKQTSILMVGHNVEYSDGGYVIWVSSALGPYWGFQQRWMKWLSGVIDNALYHVLFLDYLKSEFPILADGYPRIVAIVALTGALTYRNF